jgi:hypothetical protein
MGSKSKHWCWDSSNQLWLFKFSRPNTGEDWSEKLAAEVAELLGIPHARVELAVCEGTVGSLSLDFVVDRTQSSLVHGNELLLEIDPNYPVQQTYRLAHHTLDRVLRVLGQDFIHLPAGLATPPSVATTVDLFVSYLLLDALIGNTDRHHENWGIIERQSGTPQDRYAELARTFDHASSLGREMTDEARSTKLSAGRPEHGVEGYLAKARSALFANETDPKPLSPIAAFDQAAAQRAAVARDWLQRVADCPLSAFQALVDAVPEGRMSAVARHFVLRLIELSREQLISRIKT